MSGETTGEGLEANLALTQAPGVDDNTGAAREAAFADARDRHVARGSREYDEGVAPTEAVVEARTEVKAAPTALPVAGKAPAPAERSRDFAAPAVPPATPEVPRFDLPIGDLESLASNAGLQWVQSDSTRVTQAREAVADESPRVHVPRERPAPVVVDEGPLVLVETRKDLSQLKLPFDHKAAAARSEASDAPKMPSAVEASEPAVVAAVAAGPSTVERFAASSVVPTATATVFASTAAAVPKAHGSAEPSTAESVAPEPEAESGRGDPPASA